MVKGKATRSRQFVEEIDKEARDFVLVGLTGKCSVGISDVARFLQSGRFKNLLIQPAAGSSSRFEDSELRDYRIIQRYIRERWAPFVGVSVSDVMLSFLLDAGSIPAGAYEFGDGEPGTGDEDVMGELEQSFEEVKDSLLNESIRNVKQVNDNISARFAEGMHAPGDEDIRQEVGDLVGKISSLKDVKELWRKSLARIKDEDFSSFETVAMCFGVIPALAKAFERVLNEDHKQDHFSLVFQRLGNYIRAYGAAYPVESSVHGDCLFELPRRVDGFCMILRRYCQAVRSLSQEGPLKADGAARLNPVAIVVSSFKSIFEAYYFRARYASFYLVAVSGDLGQEGDRRSLQLGPFDVESTVSLGEDLSGSKKAFGKFWGQYVERCGASWKMKEEDKWPRGSASGLTEVQFEFCRMTFNHDRLRKSCYRKKMAPFILQDVMTCIENADVFVTRDMTLSDVSSDGRLVRDMARFLVLAMHPGLLRPTKIERCMQIAMTAKLNSGCLSRQVGAVVTDGEYNILSLGWNDVPCGVVSCSQRNILDIASWYDETAYSDFEKRDPVFRSYVNDVYAQMRIVSANGILKGLPAAYCFKDIYQDIIGERDQIHTRALHGEERALAACGNESARGGCLFTTSSPCELCAKKVKEAGIKKIYYIEQYPGISHVHVIDDGPYEIRARYVFFTGCVGLAYTKLYTPLLPYKDELEALGLSPKILRKDAIKGREDRGEQR